MHSCRGQGATKWLRQSVVRRSATILVVEDQAEIRALMEATLTAAGRRPLGVHGARPSCRIASGTGD
jgi:hypothetical protein